MKTSFGYVCGYCFNPYNQVRIRHELVHKTVFVFTKSDILILITSGINKEHPTHLTHKDQFTSLL